MISLLLVQHVCKQEAFYVIAGQFNGKVIYVGMVVALLIWFSHQL